MAGSLPLLVYAALFYLAILSPVSEAIFDLPKQKIIVQNRADDKRDIWVHCWSKDDDLGEHRLLYWQVYVMKFHPSYFLTTRFQCSVTWNNVHPKGTRTQHTLVVYSQEFDNENCGPDPFNPKKWVGCWWRIGLHSFDCPDGNLSWNSPSKRLIQ